MTKLLPFPTSEQLAGNGAGQPGAAPVGSTMQGNPQASQYTPFGAKLPGPQVGGAGQTINAPLAHDGMSRGNVPLNGQPSNTATVTPGGDSLLAQIARGQVSLNQSNYGQGTAVPRDSGPQVQQAAEPQPIQTGPGSALVPASPPNYIGD
jgi:hypothetical protein